MTEPTLNIEQARLAALYDVSSQLGTSLDLSEVLNQVMDAIIQLTGAERGFLMLYDEVTGDLRTEAARNVDQETIEGESMQISRTVLQRAAATGQNILTNNAQEDDRFSAQESVIGFQLRSIMCVPAGAKPGDGGSLRG
ncbi:MAG: GAF domain-containing protein [Chloroflexi bacterium]|nr:GAF domain-containing protein [Chloroflexota bacterium]